MTADDRRGLVHWAIARPVGTSIIAVAIVVVGGSMVGRLAVDLLPRIVREDPTLHVRSDPESGETIIAGIGERLEDLEQFHPDRMAGRILGMGDVLTRVEKAEEAVDERKARRLEAKLRKNKFDLEDLSEQLKSLGKMNLALGQEAVSISKYTGSVRSSLRRDIRTRNPNILLTNPEMLHLSFLNWHKN